MVYVILICIAVPLLLLMTLMDARSRLLTGFMLVGMLTAASAYEINSTVQVMFWMTGQEVSVRVAPVIEELLKAVPILFYSVAVSDDRKILLPLSMAVGIGFAILENAYLLTAYIDQVTISWALVRGLSTSLSHGLCTLTVGYGMSFVRKQKKLFYTGIFGLLSLAMTFHAVFNLLIQSQYDWIGMGLPILLFTMAGAIRQIVRRKTCG
ncbi:MAG TPA: PrsW family intramembrane metalloprotease [Candidatus Gemmiger excrementavium]|uniref:PrsW family intramembrane metalloprotease n=1 Tax=Candidatus Gemmiger excrementavium TaxID=2838608 RepID=A0A9D2F503_9FIRM|nr:PrsW family intramembrane metalloprotease [Candidatus Gemmiger excrementavium]